MENKTLTKKELYDLEHQKREPKEKKGAPRWLSTAFPFILLTLAVGAVGYVLLAGSGNTNTNRGLAEEVSAQDHIRGTGTKVTIVEYSDFQCPACATYEPFLKSMLDAYGNSQLRLVYRHFPLRSIHASAELTARASEAAGKQGKFWEMHDRIFEGQAVWSRGNAEEKMLGYAQALGLDMDKFKADLKSSNVISKVERDYQSGVRSGVAGTPTLFINGTQFQPNSFQELQTYIENLINQ